jgi:non-heme chloroperoxidase
MQSHIITGGGGARIHLVETGNPRGRPIVFIHGFSQSGLSWARQMHSELANDFRLVAMDLRGHGLSEKPREAYGASRLWAEDVNAAIRDLRLDRPILCGSSYGPLVILDYLRHFGEGAISGLNFIGGVTRLGGDEALSVLSQEFLNLISGFYSSDIEESTRSMNALIDLCFHRDLSAEERYCMLGFNVMVPPHVRKALFARSFDNEDLLPKLRTPTLITHGTADRVVKPSVIQQQMVRIPSARIHLMPDAGHGCFWDEADAYNRALREFAAGL